MLAQNFKTPADLDLSDDEFGALRTVLGMLERGDIKREQFHMGQIESCGSPSCLLGWARHVSRGVAFSSVLDGTKTWELAKLFRMYGPSGSGGDIAPATAAIALRNYLTHGEPRWSEALNA